ncbi:MAG: hypothetical protein K2N95_04275 [Lachnospiraceae bacterium]|nr:hypothetical protein [Lachnospiraceae bacterium]
MQKNKDVLKILPEVDQDFSRFLCQVRKEEKVLLQQLAEGLMTASQLARIEKGQRPVCKNMRDRLLGRLGIASDLYENLLNVEDYTTWEQQRNILCEIERKDLQKAQELLAAYERQEPEVSKDKIKQQFCLVMRAEILKQQDAALGEIGGCYEKAVKLTVPDVESLCIAKRLLSIQEVNMVLEYWFYHRAADFSEKCKDLMAFVETSVYDTFSKVKIYPKIAYYYLQECFSELGGQTLDRLREGLQICDRAIEMLRDTGRAFYLLEILEIKVKILERIDKSLDESRELQELERSGTACKESAELAKLLRELSEEYGVHAYMQDCTYLYRQRWMFYVGDVLRIRRTMYGLTQKELCGGDCSVRTLRRTEKREVNMQQETLGVLLKKLGLSKEFQRACLVSNDREVLKLREELADCRNNCEPKKAREVLRRMKARVSDEILENQQYIMEAEASLDWMEGKITKEQFVAREEAALQCTLKVKDLYQMKEVYLTQMEMSCIRKRIQGLSDEEKRECINFLIDFFEWHEKRNVLSECIAMYEFATIRAICELGNLEEYQLSTDLAKKVLSEDLRCKRIWGIEGYVYEILWNENEQHIKDGQIEENKKMTESLKKCIILSHFCKRTFYENFYYKKYIMYDGRLDMADHCMLKRLPPPNKSQYHRLCCRQ